MTKPRIYIETSPLIDAIKGRVNLPLTQDRKDDLWYTETSMRAAFDGQPEVVTSMLTIAECRRARQDKPPTDEMKRVIRSVLTSGKIFNLAEVTQSIAELARDLEWEHEINLKGADALHVATAIKTGCKEFYTSDARGPLNNAAKIESLGLKVIRPAQSLLLPANHKQGKFNHEEETE